MLLSTLLVLDCSSQGVTNILFVNVPFGKEQFAVALTPSPTVCFGMGLPLCAYAHLGAYVHLCAYVHLAERSLWLPIYTCVRIVYYYAAGYTVVWFAGAGAIHYVTAYPAWIST